MSRRNNVTFEGERELRPKNQLINRDIGDIEEIINRYTGDVMMRDEKILEILNSYNRFWNRGRSIIVSQG
jgi:hypothetical protein